jgi:hypothetical protein
MANTVVLKRSAVEGRVPSTSDLALGEIAINTRDGNLFFKKEIPGVPSQQSILSVATLTGIQTFTNKTLTSPTINSGTANNLTLTGTLTAGGGVGAAGQVLASTGTGVQWITKDVSTLNSLTDVIISAPSNDQVLKFNGAVWVNGDVDVATASAVFAANAESDLGLVTDLIIGLQEDLGFVIDVPATFIYNMGSLVVDGIVSLNNLDQSVKADYIAYSIIFGF